MSIVLGNWQAGKDIMPGYDDDQAAQSAWARVMGHVTALWYTTADYLLKLNRWAAANASLKISGGWYNTISGPIIASNTAKADCLGPFDLTETPDLFLRSTSGVLCEISGYGTAIADMSSVAVRNIKADTLGALIDSALRREAIWAKAGRLALDDTKINLSREATPKPGFTTDVDQNKGVMALIKRAAVGCVTCTCNPGAVGAYYVDGGLTWLNSAPTNVRWVVEGCQSPLARGLAEAKKFGAHVGAINRDVLLHMSAPLIDQHFRTLLAFAAIYGKQAKEITCAHHSSDGKTWKDWLAMVQRNSEFVERIQTLGRRTGRDEGRTEISARFTNATLRLFSTSTGLDAVFK